MTILAYVREHISIVLKYWVTLAVAGSGVVIGVVLEFPIPWMLGPIFTIVVVSLYYSIRAHRLDRKTQSITESAGNSNVIALRKANSIPKKVITPFVALPHRVLQYAIMVIGIFIGAKFDVEILTRLKVIFPLFMVLIGSMLTLVPLLYVLLRLLRFSRSDALVSALPGAFSLLIAYMVKWDLPVKRITMVHSVRIIMILVLTPLYFQNVIDIAAVSPASVSSMSFYVKWGQLLLLVGGAFTLGVLADNYIAIHGSGFIVTSLSATLLYAWGYITVAPPEWLFNLTLFVIAVSIASRLTAVEFGDLIRDCLVGVLVTSVMIILAIFFAWVLYKLTAYDFLTGVLALIPGGIHEISLIAIIYNLDPVIIAFIHWVRLVCISVSFPFLIKWLVLARERV
ncbi:hypothetical protein COTS27_00908 [Spirochaetota bacterium]|nr:hypothetical protein COTS27_00908 [Spirochaetota bacterium]